MADQSISEEQKQALVRIYLSFRREHEDERGARRARPQDRADGRRQDTAARRRRPRSRPPTADAPARPRVRHLGLSAAGVEAPGSPVASLAGAVFPAAGRL